ncbi:MAG: aminoacyl-histidine dipeptidase, partial [Alistipes sp.]|nr:aminoacyl-histidine dipeptidase [Alistipes sp.]
SPGMENRQGVVLQAHLDMVPPKNHDKQFDFTADPIDAYVDGDWVTADGTTLGADNGIGAAAILAVLADDSLVHGPLEALFTATEETGMDGAFGLQPGLLQGDILLNLDSETEGELYVGCAGGLDANIGFAYAEAPVPPGDYRALRLSVRGLKGGHSGIQIVAQRANANKLLFRFLNAEAERAGAVLASVDGGGLRNAIPREAEAVLLVPAGSCEAFGSAVASYEKTVVAEFAGIEDSISIRLDECGMPTGIIPADVASKLIKAVVGCPDGVVRMSVAMPGLVQTSTNLARVVSDGSRIGLQCLLRSSVRSEKEALGEAIAAVFALAGAETELTGSYDGWNPNMSSPILGAMTASYEQLYGRKPAVTAIHAGLECGIIGSNYPDLDMISFGPTILYPHSPDEKVEIASVAKFYDFLVRTLAN